ncbi:hypothetical protein HanPI659440_Chr09g0320581 [Helianthus annuus]|nr:hypothetical protein HanPI659440_Chr09g0320581 [Helianthus annuus]
MSSFSVLSTYTPQPPKPSLRRLPHSESGQGAFVETNRHRFPDNHFVLLDFPIFYSCVISQGILLRNQCEYT